MSHRKGRPGPTATEPTSHHPVFSCVHRRRVSPELKPDALPTRSDEKSVTEFGKAVLRWPVLPVQACSAPASERPHCRTAPRAPTARPRGPCRMTQCVIDANSPRHQSVDNGEKSRVGRALRRQKEEVENVPDALWRAGLAIKPFRDGTMPRPGDSVKAQSAEITRFPFWLERVTRSRL